MPIIETVNQIDFHRAFLRMNRAKQMGGVAGCDALFDHLEEVYGEDGETWELDVIGLCCDFTQYDDLGEMLDEYMAVDIEQIVDNTTVITYTETVLEGTKLITYDRFIVQDY